MKSIKVIGISLLMTMMLSGCNYGLLGAGYTQKLVDLYATMKAGGDKTPNPFLGGLSEYDVVKAQLVKAKNWEVDSSTFSAGKEARKVSLEVIKDSIKEAKKFKGKAVSLKDLAAIDKFYDDAFVKTCVAGGSAFVANISSNGRGEKLNFDLPFDKTKLPAGEPLNIIPTTDINAYCRAVVSNHYYSHESSFDKSILTANADDNAKAIAGWLKNNLSPSFNVLNILEGSGIE